MALKSLFEVVSKSFVFVFSLVMSCLVNTLLFSKGVSVFHSASDKVELCTDSKNMKTTNVLTVERDLSFIHCAKSLGHPYGYFGYEMF